MLVGLMNAEKAAQEEEMTHLLNLLFSAASPGAGSWKGWWRPDCPA